MTLYLWMKTGCGCDYSIGCGEVLVSLKATTIENARDEAKKKMQDFSLQDIENRHNAQALILELKEDAQGILDELVEEDDDDSIKNEMEEKQKVIEQAKRELAELKSKKARKAR